jgi:hypothetical protein
VRKQLTGSAAGDYATSSSSFVDVDGTNLKGGLSGLTNNQVVMISWAFEYHCGGVTGVINWQLIETNTSAVIASGNTASSSFQTAAGLAAFAIQGTSVNVSLQWDVTQSGSGNTGTIRNTNSAGQYLTPSILIFA